MVGQAPKRLDHFRPARSACLFYTYERERERERGRAYIALLPISVSIYPYQSLYLCPLTFDSVSGKPGTSAECSSRPATRLCRGTNKRPCFIGTRSFPWTLPQSNPSQWRALATDGRRNTSTIRGTGRL